MVIKLRLLFIDYFCETTVNITSSELYLCVRNCVGGFKPCMKCLARLLSAENGAGQLYLMDAYQSTSSLTSFKAELKMHLFNAAFN